MKNMKRWNVAVGLTLAMSVSSASAAQVSLSGATVEFSFDDSFLSSLFGSYSVSGDTLSFSPTTFSAQQIGLGLALKNATTPLITVSAKSGYLLTALDLFEQGDYSRVQNGSDTTFVSLGGQFIVNDTQTSITVTNPFDSVTTISSLIALSPWSTTNWTATGEVDLSPVDSATVKVESLLMAGVVVGSGLNMAFIEKNLLKIGVSTMPEVMQIPVPLPASVWTFGVAVMGFLYTRRRADSVKTVR